MNATPIRHLGIGCLLLVAALLLFPSGTAWAQGGMSSMGAGMGGMGGGGMGGGMGGAGGGGGPPMGVKKKKYKREPISRVNHGRTTFTIAAIVDDKVILLEDIMDTLRPRLEQQKRVMPPDQYKEFEKQFVEMAVKGKIQQTLMLNELKRKIPKPEVMEKIREAANLDFEKHMQELAKQSNMKSMDELMAQLKKEGADLAALKKAFVENALAQQFLGSQIMPKLRDPTREEMEDYYNEHIDKWSQKAGVVWRNIEIKKGSDPASSRAKISDIKEKLDEGADFAELAKSSSEGTMAAAGGLWSKTSKGSYHDEAIDEALFSLPVGELSPVIEGKTSFHLIIVEERNDGSPIPFPQVQDEIKNILKNKQIEKYRKQLLEEIGASHHVISIFDDEHLMNHQLARPDQQNIIR